MKTPKVLPKDQMGRQTTPEQWEQYQLDLKNHEAWIEGRREFLKRIIETAIMKGSKATLDQFNYELDLKLSMDAPNYPGYYRANND